MFIYRPTSAPSPVARFGDVAGYRRRSKRGDWGMEPQSWHRNGGEEREHLLALVDGTFERRLQIRQSTARAQIAHFSYSCPGRHGRGKQRVYRWDLFFSVTPTPPWKLLCKKIVSKSGLEVMASRYFGSAVMGSML